MLGLFEAFSLKCLQLQRAVNSGHDELVRVLDRELDPLIEIILSYRATNACEIHMQLQFLSNLIREDADDQSCVMRHSAAMSMLIDRYFSTGNGHVVGIDQDLDTRIEPVNLMRGQDEMLLNEAILDSMPDRIAVITTDYRYLYSNPVNARHLNNTPMSLIGRHLAEFIGERRFHEETKQRLDQCFAGDTVDYVSQRQYAHTTKRMRCRMTPLHSPSRKVIGAIVLLQDYSETGRIAAE